MIGLGAATKLYPLFLLGPILDRGWRRAPARGVRRDGGCRRRRPGRWSTSRVADRPEQWKVFWRFNSERGADLGSVWLALTARGALLHAAHDQHLVVGAVRGGLRRRGGARTAVRRTPRVAQLAFLVVAGFLLVNKVYSPQYVLWLLPLAVLARPRWRDLLIWQAGELLYLRPCGPTSVVRSRRRPAEAPRLRPGDLDPGRGRALPGGRGGARRRTPRA